jgi:hypothetical protein
MEITPGVYGEYRVGASRGAQVDDAVLPRRNNSDHRKKTEKRRENNK